MAPLWSTLHSISLATTQVDLTETTTQVSSIIRLIFALLDHLPCLQELPLLVGFQRKVCRGEMVLGCLCSSKAREGEGRGDDTDLDLKSQQFPLFGAILPILHRLFCSQRTFGPILCQSSLFLPHRKITHSTFDICFCTTTLLSSKTVTLQSSDILYLRNTTVTVISSQLKNQT